MGAVGDLVKSGLGALGSVAGTALGGPIGGMIGGAIGKFAGGPLGDAIFGGFMKDPIGSLANPASIVSAGADALLGQFGLQAPFRSLAKFAQNPLGTIMDSLKGFENPIRPVAKGGGFAPEVGLTTNGKDCVDTGRYLISGGENELKIYDKQTNTWVKAHGDPHLITSDGDKGQFHENLTLDLPDGTKVTIKTTPKDANGIALIDAVAIMKGSEAVVMAGFSDAKPGVQVGNVLNNADAVDRAWDDGTVMRAGKQVDDLTFAADGKELVGSDPNARWGEHVLDGKGGKSINTWKPDYADDINRLRDDMRPAGAKGASGAQGTGESTAAKGGDIYSRLFAVLAKLQKDMEGKVEQMENIDSKDKAAMDKASFELQQIQQMMSQLTQMATSMLQREGQDRQAIIQNFRA
jgi:hypothetical protein